MTAEVIKVIIYFMIHILFHHVGLVGFLKSQREMSKNDKRWFNFEGPLEGIQQSDITLTNWLSFCAHKLRKRTCRILMSLSKWYPRVITHFVNPFQLSDKICI